MRFVVAGICALAVACTTRMPHGTYAPQPFDALVEVTMPPPPARVEVVPPRPQASTVWVDGEWTWRRLRWAWMPGRWVTAPAGTAFSPWVFVRGSDGRLWYAPGVWRDAKGAAVEAPPPLAAATVESGIVVGADGTPGSTGPTLRPGQRSRAAAPP